MPASEVVINHQRMQEVFDPLITRVLANAAPYNRLRHMLPQTKDNLPEGMVWGSDQHARFLWTSCLYMRGGLESDVAMRRLGIICKEKPHLFAPDFGPSDEELALLTKEDVAAIKASTAPTTGPQSLFCDETITEPILTGPTTQILAPYKAELKNALRSLIKKGWIRTALTGY